MCLQELADDGYELPQIIMQYRSLSKLKSTYTDKLPQQVNQQTGRVHTSYHQAVTATGRLSSSDPNLQNIPIRTETGRKIREAFVAGKGAKILAADYSQIELRIMAHLSGDKSLLTAFAEGEDIHRHTASENLWCGTRKCHWGSTSQCQSHQLWFNLRYVRPRTIQTTGHRTSSGCQIYGNLFRTLSRCQKLHGQYPRAGQKRWLR